MIACSILHAASLHAEDRLPSFSAPRELDVPAKAGSTEPRLRVLQDGGLLLTWLEPKGTSGRSLRVAIRRNARWSVPSTVVSGTELIANGADFPNAIDMADGSLVAAWLQKDGQGEASSIWISVSHDKGGHWSGPRRLHRDMSHTEHGFVSLARSGNGVMAIWLDGHRFAGVREESGADMTLHAVEIGADGGLGAEREIDGRVCDCCQTAAVTAGAEIWTAFRDRSAAEVRDISLARYDRGSWQTLTGPAPDGWKIEGCPVNGPAMATRGDRVGLAWFTAAENRARVLAAFAGSTEPAFSRPLRVDLGRPVGRVGMALLSPEDAVVSWVEMDSTGKAQLLLRSVRQRGPLGSPVRIASLGAKPRGVPQVVARGDLIYVAWTEAGAPPRVHLAGIRVE